MTLRHTFFHRSSASLGVVTAVFVASLLTLQSCKGADVVGSLASLVLTTPAEPADDRVLNARVKKALSESPVTRSMDIGVDSQKGVVLLSGMVQDPTQLDLAVFIAQNVPGVSQVDSFMFSSGVTLTSPTRSSYTPAPDFVPPQRVVRRLRSGEPIAMKGLPTVATAGPTAPASHTAPAVPAMSVPVETNTTRATTAQEPVSAVRRLVTVAYGVMGISNVYDELLIRH